MFFGIFSILIYLALLVAIIYAVRGLVTWYFKINEIVDLLKSIDRKLGNEIMRTNIDQLSGDR